MSKTRNIKKIYRLDDPSVDESLSILRKNKSCIITVNGCFDIFTFGHLGILNCANLYKEFNNGGVIIGLNSDKSIKKLKGEKRPILNEQERSLFLSNFMFIDMILIYDSLTSVDFVRKVKPNYHINDDSYGEHCIEREPVLENGGTLVLYRKLDGYPSSTEIIERILEKYK